MSSKFTMYLNSKTSKMDNLDIYWIENIQTKLQIGILAP